MSQPYRVISADSHILEPPDLWQDRVAKRYKAQAPRLERLEGGDQWFMGDEVLGTLGSAIMQAGARVEQYDEKQFGRMEAEDWESMKGGRWEDVLPGGYQPKEFIKDSELDGVYASVLYPSMGLTMFRRPNSPLLHELFRAYNDWMGEFVEEDPNRLKGVGLVLLDDVRASVKEMERCAQMKLGGIQIPTYPEPHRPYHDPSYEPFWEAAESLGMPIGLHIQSWRSQPTVGQIGPGRDGAAVDPELAAFVGGAEIAQSLKRSPVDFLGTTDYWVRRAVGEMIFSGVFERHPDLKVVCVEFDTGFVPYFLSRMDWTYYEFPDFMSKENRFQGDTLPSDYWKQNVRLTFQEDPLGLQRLRDLIGPETMMWGSDYPHRESTWPKSLEKIEETFLGVPDEEKKMIIGGTAAKLYNIK